MSQNYNVEFNPIQCTSSVFKNLTAQDGFLYFITDTKKLYLGKDGKFVEMCGGTNIFYGIKEIEYVNNGQPLNPKVVFYLNELDGEDVVPLPNDLILNTDGCFYKIETVEENMISTMRLTLQGSGGGASSSGPVVGGSGYSINLSPKENIFASQAETMYINFYATAAEPTENYISRIQITKDAPISETNPPIFEEEGYFQIGTIAERQEYGFNLINLKDDYFDTNAKIFYINTTDAYGTPMSEKFTVQIIDLQLDTSTEVCEPSVFAIKNNVYSYDAKVIGGTSSVEDKKMVFAFYRNNSTSDEPIFTQEKTLNLNDTDVTSTLKTDALSHGVYKLKVWAQAKIKNTNKIIKSNVLTHVVACFAVGASKPLLAINLPDKIEQYTNIPLNYLLVSEEADKVYTLNIFINGILKTSLAVSSNAAASYSLYFENKGTQSLELYIAEVGDLKQKFTLDVLPYEGFLPIIKPEDENLMLYLTPKGQSNNAVDPTSWKDYNNKYEAKLSDMHFSNTTGWLKDSKGIDYLSLASGGKLNIPDFYPFALDPTKTSILDTFVGKGMTIELDLEVSGITNYNAEIIKCISLTEKSIIAVGFKLIGNQFYFYNSGKNGHGNSGSLSSIKIVENKRTRISFVIEPNKGPGTFPMLLTYLNGVLSGAAIYSADNDEFADNAVPAKLTIDSTNASVKIYGIRFYRTALSDKNILNNFTASLDTLKEREDRYYSNNVFKANNTIDYKAVSRSDYNLEIPYMVISGGWQTEAETDKWQLMSKDDIGTAGLPTGKKNYRLIDVSVIYPKNSNYFAGYKDFHYKNEFDNNLGIAENFGNKPKNKTGCIMYCQGTSSMEYPVKNLRLRFRHKDHYFKVKPDIEPVSIICMKADYMESSGSHNTGAANLIDDLYAGASPALKTPGQVEFGPNSDNPDRSRIVTCIKGHPCLIFYTPTGKEDDMTYIGKYNLNLDKATPEPFGFKSNENSGFGFLKEGEQYWKVAYGDKNDGFKETFIGQEKPEEGGDYFPGQTEESATVGERDKINSIHCFEFLDNAVSVCNFLTKTISNKDSQADSRPVETYSYEEMPVTEKEFNENDITYYIKSGSNYTAATTFDTSTTYYVRKYTYYDTWYRNFLNKENKIVPGWALGFESRYPEDRVGTHDADMLWPLASWLNTLYNLRKEDEEQGLTPDQVTYVYSYERAHSFKDMTSYFIKDGETFIPAYPTEENFGLGEYYTRTLRNTRFAMKSLERFKREYQCYLNKDFLLAYYVITEALLMADSRVKNMMIATWGREPGSYLDIDNEDAEVSTNNYMFYPIFYDMDTMLGLDNTGASRFNYYDEDTDPSIYNGEEVLWNFVRDALFLEIDQMYGRLEKAGLNIDKGRVGGWDPKSILPYFNNNQAYMANEAFYNADAKYKYIEPAVSGYHDYLNNEWVDAGKAPYLYAAQGDRGLTREDFVTNRIKFLRGKHNSEDFQIKDRITFRWYSPSGNEAEFRVPLGTAADGSEITARKSIEVVPPTYDFNFTSLQTCYAGVLLGANGNVSSARFNGEETVRISVPEGRAANGTEAYLLGTGSLKDLGDLSSKYMQKFELNSENKLKTLTLGNPYRYYYNPYWAPKSGTSSQPISISGCTYLEEFNFQNCSTYNATVDFTKCPAISKVLLTGSGVTGVSFPVNGNLTEVRLPTSVINLSIDSHKNLTAENFSLGDYEYGPTDIIGGAGGRYLNNYSFLQNVSIANTPIDSYDIITKAVSLRSYSLEGIDWRITSDKNNDQYIPTSDISPIPGKVYYKLNPETDTYVSLGTVTEQYFIENKSLIKERCLLIEDSKVSKIPVLELLLTKSPKKNQVDVTRASALTGKITLAVSAAIDQFALYEKYQKDFPNLIIDYDETIVGDNLVKAHKIEFYNTPEITDQTEPYYSVLTNGSYDLEYLTSARGPAASTLTTPSMSSTDTINYIFSNAWMDYDTGEKDEEGKWVVNPTVYNVSDFKNIIPTKDLRLVPIYTPQTRTYDVTLHDYQGIELDLGSNNPLKYEFNQALGTHDNAIVYLHRDDSDLEEFQRYDFKGWITKADFNLLQADKNHTPTVLDVEDYAVTYAIDLYPYYKVENVKTTPNSLKMFEFNENKLTGKSTPVSVTYSYTEYTADLDRESKYYTTPRSKEVTGIVISMKPKYQQQFKGKLTLPSFDKDGNPIQILGSLGTKSKITEAYFLNDNQYIGISSSSNTWGFYSCAELKKVYFPAGNTSLKYIGQYGFYNNPKLVTIENLPNSIELIGYEAFSGDIQLQLETLPSNLIYISSRAFYNAQNITIDSLPRGLTALTSDVFKNCLNIKLYSFGNNGGLVEGHDNNIMVIEAAALANAANLPDNNTLYLKSSIISILGDAFVNYNSKKSSITVYNSTILNLEETKNVIFGTPDNGGNRFTIQPFNIEDISEEII